MKLKTYTLKACLCLCIIFVFNPFNAKGNNDISINFIEKQSFRDIQDIAYEQEKPIFITFHAVWSTPCYEANKTVFQNDKVAQYMNENFINYSANIERKIGKSLADYFDIYHLPTVLILTPRGDVIMKSSNVLNPKKFIKWAKEANEIYLSQKEIEEAEKEGTDTKFLYKNDLAIKNTSFITKKEYIRQSYFRE